MEFYKLKLKWIIIDYWCQWGSSGNTSDKCIYNDAIMPRLFIYQDVITFIWSYGQFIQSTHQFLKKGRVEYIGVLQTPIVHVSFPHKELLRLLSSVLVFIEFIPQNSAKHRIKKTVIILSNSLIISQKRNTAKITCLPCHCAQILKR